MDQDTKEKSIRGEMDEYVDTEEPKLCETVESGGGEGRKMCLSK